MTTHVGHAGAQSLATATTSARSGDGYIPLGPREGVLTHVTAVCPADTPPLQFTVELLAPVGPSATIMRGWIRGGSVTGGSGQKYLDHEVAFPPNSRLYMLVRNDTGETVTYDFWAFWRDV